ncbi:putative cytoplasmic protein [Streptococcus pneumoniae]|nr:putative cytoplasmic protein [Streptococcus pneumoniae]CIW16803.1 putative cytoplasmic protein [Streptococcus pneumoniae]CRF30607.1 putative cytoplasmic protein [Streptococcus pneumoniae]
MLNYNFQSKFPQLFPIFYKKIEIQVADAKVNVGKDSFEGYTLTIGKKVIGEIAELDGQFAIIKNGNVDSFYKKLEKAVEILIENYNLAK